jgi:hypothetical protein
MRFTCYYVLPPVFLILAPFLLTYLIRMDYYAVLPLSYWKYENSRS